MKQRGITLIALVVTIVILLILAGVSISMLSGQEGLITTARKSAKETIIQSEKESIELELLNLSTEKFAKGESCTLDYISENITIDGIEVVGKKGDPLAKLYITYKGNMFKINQALEVSYVGNINIKEEPVIEIVRDSTITGVEQVKLSVKATVEEGEISEIVMPDGKIKYDDEANYTVTENGEYTFKAVTANGQEESKTIKIETIKVKGAIEIGTSSEQGSGQIQCSHVYETKYNDSQHWKQCIFCANKIDEKNHNIVTEGEYTCSTSVPAQRERCQDGCGYSKTLPKKSHTKDVATKANSYTHRYNCKECSVMVSDETCKDKDGNVLGCRTGKTGVCATCGNNYTNARCIEIRDR